jgi:hypothetical protein
MKGASEFLLYIQLSARFEFFIPSFSSLFLVENKSKKFPLKIFSPTPFFIEKEDRYVHKNQFSKLLCTQCDISFLNKEKIFNP